MNYLFIALERSDSYDIITSCINILGNMYYE